MVHFSCWFDLPTCALMGTAKRSVFNITNIRNIPLHFTSYPHVVFYAITRLCIISTLDSTLLHSKDVDVF
jgi:hypothetical protein